MEARHALEGFKVIVELFDQAVACNHQRGMFQCFIQRCPREHVCQLRTHVSQCPDCNIQPDGALFVGQCLAGLLPGLFPGRLMRSKDIQAGTSRTHGRCAACQRGKQGHHRLSNRAGTLGQVSGLGFP